MNVTKESEESLLSLGMTEHELYALKNQFNYINWLI